MQGREWGKKKRRTRRNENGESQERFFFKNARRLRMNEGRKGLSGARYTCASFSCAVGSSDAASVIEAAWRVGIAIQCICVCVRVYKWFVRACTSEKSHRPSANSRATVSSRQNGVFPKQRGYRALCSRNARTSFRYLVCRVAAVSSPVFIATRMCRVAHAPARPAGKGRSER